jgi:hypothetical protein
MIVLNDLTTINDKVYYFNWFAKPKERGLFLFGQFSRSLINITELSNIALNGKYMRRWAF